MAINREKHTLTAKGVSLGRVATQAADFLMGKNKASYVPYLDQGDFVEVTDFKKVKITGDKLRQKLYYRPTTRPGSLKSENMATLLARRPHEVLKRAVWGMLPKNTLRKSMIKRLTISD